MRISDWSSDVCSSDLPIVSMLNRMRPALPQIPSDADVPGEARLFHTNAWPGQRRTGQGGGHWTGDTSAEAARASFDHLKTMPIGEGWDFSVDRTQRLIHSHRVLSRWDERCTGKHGDQRRESGG